MDNLDNLIKLSVNVEMTMNRSKDYLYSMGEAIIKSTKAYIKAIENNDMCNEQFFIEFEDELNKLSVKDHNASQNS